MDCQSRSRDRKSFDETSEGAKKPNYLSRVPRSGNPQALDDLFASKRLFRRAICLSKRIGLAQSPLPTSSTQTGSCWLLRTNLTPAKPMPHERQ